MESSTDRKALTFDAAAAIGAFGNGHSVIGRIMPTLIPCSRAAITAFFETRAAIPKATTQMSASSIMNSSYIVSFSATVLYFSYLLKLSASSSSATRESEFMILCGRFIPVPVAAHGFSCFATSPTLSSTGSII